MIPLFFAASVCGQSTALNQDPTLRHILKAEKEGRLVDAEKLLQAAIQDAETQSATSPRLRLLLNHLAVVNERMGRYADAVALAKRVLDMDDRLYGAESPDAARDLNNLGFFYQAAGEEAAAGQALERALAVARKNPGDGWLHATGNLSAYYTAHHRTADAKPLLTEAVEFCDAHPEPRVSAVCTGLRTQLADVYRSEGHSGYGEEIVSRDAEQTVGVLQDSFARVGALDALARQYEQDESYDLAEATYRRSIALIEKMPQFKDDPAATAPEYLRLGKLFEKEGLIVQAEDAYKHALDSEEAAPVPGRPGHAQSLFGFVIPLAGLYRTEGRVSDLEPILQQVLALQERDLGPDRAEIADTLLELAGVYQEEEKYPDAAPLYQRALKIQEKNVGPDNPRLLRALNGYAAVLRQLGDPEEAQAVTARASALRQKLAQHTPEAPAHN
jgi:tetratricopeptide (TPR) repeat protein